MARLMSRCLADIARDYVDTDADSKIADAALRQKVPDFETHWNAFLLAERRAGEISKVQGGMSEISLCRRSSAQNWATNARNSP